MGLIILAGLPNSTTVHQEMDALYGPFKTATYAQGEHVLMEKIKEQGMQCGAAVPGASILSLGFDNFATIVDGKTGDDISLKPFTKHFTEEKVLRAWAKVGFVPFTRRCMTDKKVCHELGQENVNADLEVLHDKYADLVAAAEDHGLNRGVFIAAIPVAYRLQRVVDEDEQVRLLL
jgi:hypothetical protein